MTQLAGDQVAELCHRVGVPNVWVVTAIAICWAESGLRTDAVGINRDPETHQILSRDRGLWQINDYWHSEVSDACAFDATCNAQQMYRISSGGKLFGPWSTYNSGAYKQYVRMAQLADSYYLTGSAGVGGPPAPGPTGPPPPVANGDAIVEITNGYSPIGATARLMQRLFDETIDAKYGPGHRFGSLFGGIIQ